MDKTGSCREIMSVEFSSTHSRRL